MTQSDDKPVEGRSELDDAEVAFDPDEPYRQVAGFGESELKVERSRFIGQMLPVYSEEEAHTYVEEMRSEHHDARHVCFGLRVGRGAQRVDRSNDDGEPPRTGGFPIWQVLDGEDVTNSLGVVVRYFGGVELGMGGLRRAYRNAAREALSAAGVRTVHPEDELVLTVPYEQFGSLEHLVESRPAVRFKEQSFGAKVEVTLAIRAASSEQELEVLAGELEREVEALRESLEEG